MAKLILTRGVPASGKSTWAKAWVAEDPENRLRVNRDNLRWTLGIKEGVGTFEQENEVSHWEKAMARRALQSGKDVVVDATNLRAKRVKEWLWLASDENVSVEFEDFPVTYEVARRRDIERKQRGERFVGQEVIKEKFFDKFIGKDGSLPPIPEITASELPTGSYRPYTHTQHLPRAIIVDIDGTTAHMSGRSPYDPSLYHTDEPDVVLRDLIDAYEGVHGIWVIYVSGRNEDYREVTEKWLDDHLFYRDEFYMRPSGDNRNDAIVKNELFEKYIAGRYNIDFVLDDRNRVVEMWRAKGLKVLQVADGNF